MFVVFQDFPLNERRFFVNIDCFGNIYTATHINKAKRLLTFDAARTLTDALNLDNEGGVPFNFQEV